MRLSQNILHCILLGATNDYFHYLPIKFLFNLFILLSIKCHKIRKMFFFFLNFIVVRFLTVVKINTNNILFMI